MFFIDLALTASILIGTAVALPGIIKQTSNIEPKEVLTRTGAIVLREEEKTELALKINWAGLTTEQVSPAFIQGSKVALAGAICVFSAGLSILSPSYLFLLIFAPVGYLLPNMWLNSKIRKRQEEIENKLDQFSLYLSTALISMSNMTDALIQSAYAVGGCV